MTRQRALFRTLLLAAAVTVLAPVAPAVANSDPNYTGVEDIIGNGSVVIERGGRYYMTAVSHRGGSLGDDVYASKPTNRYVGRHAYKSNTANPGYPDYTLIDMGTTPHSPRVRVSGDYYFYTAKGAFVYGTTQTTPAPTGADWTYGTELCFTAWPNDGSPTVRVRCGYADNGVPGSRCARTNAVPVCGIRSNDGSAFVIGGDSGGLVWQPKPYGQVRPVGLITQCTVAVPCSAALFAPFYGFTKYPFAASETLFGYPTGAGGRVVTG